ncbi:: DDE_Tnp_IS66 [Gemmata massiliana]|uniref:: DDE_Tnp_IS66 n=1 Tax=Gemmata massiliana TaxID=1210884 RepID=A0A6P2CVY4_9BACT|nr:: DDE_Tnp_IS66 [Gemmata massiliana]
MRRKFVAATEAGDGRAARQLELIGKLYATERALPPRPALIRTFKPSHSA